MKIAEALPDIFKRTYPALESGTQLFLAASLLRFHQIDAIPIGFKKREEKHLAVLGYSCLSRLLQTDPFSYKEFLKQPCENAAQQLAIIPADADVERLLRLFGKTRSGFAIVEGKFELGALVGLRDIIGLYKKGLLSTTLSVDQIASPIFSMPSSSTLRQVLTEMFTRRFRRIFLDGNKNDSVITDRKIISYIFETSRLDEGVVHSQSNLLDTTIEKLDLMQPAKLSGRSKLKNAAAIMMAEKAECLVCEKGVITPWDLVMKPWKMGKLNLKN